MYHLLTFDFSMMSYKSLKLFTFFGTPCSSSLSWPFGLVQSALGLKNNIFFHASLLHKCSSRSFIQQTCSRPCDPFESLAPPPGGGHFHSKVIGMLVVFVRV